jgi:hypothetical protein
MGLPCRATVRGPVVCGPFSWVQNRPAGNILFWDNPGWDIILALMGEGRLTKSLFSPAYTRFLALLKQARVDAGLTQSEAARRLGKPQSFISMCESGSYIVRGRSLCQAWAMSGKALQHSAIRSQGLANWS